MSTELQITCSPLDWDSSIIIATGIELSDGRILLPQSIIASDLAEPLLSIWHAAVNQLLNVAPGEWAAQYVTVTKQCEFPYIAYDSNDKEEQSNAQTAIPFISVNMQRIWDDGSTSIPVNMKLQDENMILFFDSLTNESFWRE